jgi:hypothetical protein
VQHKQCGSCFLHVQATDDQSRCTGEELAKEKLLQAKELCSQAYESLHVRSSVGLAIAMRLHLWPTMNSVSCVGGAWSFGR